MQRIAFPHVEPYNFCFRTESLWLDPIAYPQSASLPHLQTT